MAKRVIGISGVARAGKDTFAAILIKKLSLQNYTVKRIALADALKKDCDEFCKKTLGISSFNQVPDEKLLIRPLLVWYGDAQRKRTNGRYWINLAQKQIDETSFDYYVITDVRYSHYENDEGQWIQNECKGLICHVSKWGFYSFPVGDGSYSGMAQWRCIPPANEHEALNDPKMKKLANFIVEWPDIGEVENLLNHPQLNKYVDNFILVQNRHFHHSRSNQENPVVSVQAPL